MYNIKDGFRLEDPGVFVPWDTDEKGLEILLGQYGLRKVKRGYYCISCKSLGGVEHELGFHFENPEDKAKREELEKYARSLGKIIRKVEPHHDPTREGKIKELELFRKEYPDLRGSFEEFQSALEKGFGKPTRSSLEDTGFAINEWELEGVKIWHYVIDRFGLEEHVRIRKYHRNLLFLTGAKACVFYVFRTHGNRVLRDFGAGFRMLRLRYALGTADGSMTADAIAVYGQSDPSDRLWGAMDQYSSSC